MPHKKPAEVYVDNGKTTLLCEDAYIKDGWAVVRCVGADTYEWYPPHRVFRVKRTPITPAATESESVQDLERICPECGGDSLPADWETPKPLRQLTGPITMECEHGHEWRWPTESTETDTEPAEAAPSADVSLRTELAAHLADHDVPLIPEERNGKFYLAKDGYIEDFDRWIGNDRVKYDSDQTPENWIAREDVLGYIRETGT